jgi:hypothetical protein
MARHALTRVHVSITSGYATRHGQLRCHHTSRGTSSCLLARGSSSAATCPVALALESRVGAAQVLPRVLWRQLPPPGTWQLRSHHVSRDSSSRLLAYVSSGAVTCPTELYGLWAIDVNNVSKYRICLVLTCNVIVARRRSLRPRQPPPHSRLTTTPH